jgi:hypothetical protein
MQKKVFVLVGVFLCMALVLPESNLATSQNEGKTISTNKDKVLTIAVQGQIVPASPQFQYTTTWDGKPKRAIGVGGINYNLKVGEYVFGWSCGDRATMGVATTGVGNERFDSGYYSYASIGNEIRVLGGKASGDKGIVIGKFGRYVLVHFDDKTLEQLAIGDTLHGKARGIGLKIDGFDDVHVHGIAPELLEKLGIMDIGDKLEVPVVKEIPAILAGQGSGGSATYGNWHIQTCYPPDIEKYGLDELRFGDLVLLQDIQTDYGKGYYKGGATVGVICSGPSDISGLGIGVTPILSTRFGKLAARIDSTANIGNHLGIRVNSGNKPEISKISIASKTTQERPTVLKTNKDKLITTAVQAVVQPAGGYGGWGYPVTYDGKPKQLIGMASINYTVSLGDPAYGWASADHVEPDVTVQGRDRESPYECAIAILACIGNEARVISGEAKGAEGYYIGRHAGSDDLCWFPKKVIEKLALNDKIQVKAQGVGLKIEGFEDVRVNKLSPQLLENLGISIEDGQLVVPVVMEIDGYIMGSGIGGPTIEAVDYDIQTTDPHIVEKYGLKRLKLGDLVAIRNHYDYYGRGRYEGAVTIGVCIHGWSDLAGHGPGLNPVLSALPGVIKTKIDPHANTAYYLGIKKKPKK